MRIDASEIEQPITARFRRQVAANPDGIAVRTVSASLTYSELDRLTDRIAGAILARLGPRLSPVAILCDDATRAMAGIFGILKARKIWVPLDSTYPDARLDFLLEDSGARLVLTTGDLERRAGADAADRAILNLDDNLDGENPDTRELTGSPDDRACILYTSGSTGRPKGVVHTHRNILHNASVWTRRYGFTAHDRVLLLSSLGHVAAVTDIFRSLLNGGALYPYRLQSGAVTDLARWIADERITVYHSVPSVFRRLARALPGDGCLPDVRLVHLGGETVTRTDVELFQARFRDDCLLVNNLSATEIPAFLQFALDATTPLRGRTVPVGHAVEGKTIELWDENDRPVGDSEVGEIIVQSPYLAVEYWRRPELTGASFLTDPAGGPRRYRTGDLGRRSADGCVTYVGRKDSQVKIRGHRVEPGEVESVLGEHPDVDAGVVLYRDLPTGEKGLVACVTAVAGRTLNEKGVRSFLEARLPHFMVPSVVVPLDSMPLTPNGKVDRGRLPPEGSLSHEPASSGEAAWPRDAAEKQMLDLWRQILGHPSLGVKDDFFEMGGHSLLAVELLGEVERVFGAKLPIPALQKSPTVEGLVREVQAQAGSSPWPCLIPLRTTGTRSPLFLVHGLGGVIVELRALLPHLHPEQPLYALQARGIDGVSTPNRTIEEMADVYLEEIRSVAPSGPYHLGGYSMGGIVAFEMARRLVAEGHSVATLILIDTFSPYRIWTARDHYGMAREMVRSLRREARRKGALRAVRDVVRRMRHGAPDRPGTEDDTPRSAVARTIEQVREWNAIAMRRYAPALYPGRISFLLSTDVSGQPADGPPDSLRDVAPGMAGTRRLWERFAGDGFDVHPVAGGHFDLMKPPNVGPVAREIQSCLDATPRPPATAADRPRRRGRSASPDSTASGSRDRWPARGH